jgi:hypothetical protein
MIGHQAAPVVLGGRMIGDAAGAARERGAGHAAIMAMLFATASSTASRKPGSHHVFPKRSADGAYPHVADDPMPVTGILD